MKYHHFPAEIEQEAQKALVHYPGLSETTIHFRFNRIGVQSYMLAQPVVSTLLRSRHQREYQILIRRKFFIENKQFQDGRVPFDVLVGWLGHELGHIMDYRDRSGLNLIFFGLRYHFFRSFLKKAEIVADRNAVMAGLGQEIIVSKKFGRDPRYFPASYIRKLNQLYPSVEQVKGWIMAKSSKKTA